MKRDMDLARQILLAIEDNDQAPQGWIDLEIPDRSVDEVAYHVMLLGEAGLIDVVDASSSSGFDWKPVRLTWAGHEFIEVARRETTWNRAKTIAADTSGGLALDLLKEILHRLAEQGLDIILPS